ncbi:hypothetical protein Q4589_05190 [Cobetia marina]|jgi:hypothetical protein|uniref:Lipoprotein n=1 Tax=Cobetia marina TaxID=28258 RepID=A0ABU9GGF0_COBMA|nr:MULTISPECIES: hypothetical protein [Cobetia]MDA5562638.1 hypothetical protein [Cobetia sp. MMG027]MDH2373084.1 hypothetical protein [Cobetia sp. 3AK]MDI6002691.1 hypothetical protein [Cobetia pacifica]MDN2657387.1 hypothetical protein [Cobetia sp. 14N.309.X.WAT.E.A4]MDO6786980.1 hypothetical protein [Cobetia marina]
MRIKNLFPIALVAATLALGGCGLFDHGHGGHGGGHGGGQQHGMIDTGSQASHLS